MLSWWLEPSLHSITINFYSCYCEHPYFYGGQHATLTSCGRGSPWRLCWSRRASQRKEGTFGRACKSWLGAGTGNTIQLDDAVQAKAV